MERTRFRTASMLGLLLAASALTNGCGQPAPENQATTAATETSEITVELPSPALAGTMSVEEALQLRRSVRTFASTPLTLAEVSQLLWSAQGRTSDSGGRTVPSAGALYPLEVLLVAGNVEGLAAGVYRYDPDSHGLAQVSAGDRREELADASLGQEPIRTSPASLVITGVYARTTGKYGDRGVQFVHMEAGHAAQNVYLQATASGLGTVSIGAITAAEGQATLDLPEDEIPLYVLPAGRVG
jgi:SagB-type dehydrogenase family enzyme